MGIEQHSSLRQLELGKALAGRRKVYLDACFWVAMRDASLQEDADPVKRKLLHYLRKGIRNGKLVCPISAPMFLELMKQAFKPERRIGTAKIIDELSLGVAILPHPSLMELEIKRFLLGSQGGNQCQPIHHSVWTRVTYVLGDIYLSAGKPECADELSMQKAFFDRMWNMSLLDIVSTIGDSYSQDDSFSVLSEKINKNNVLHRDELCSFEQTYDIELRGIIDEAAEVMARILEQTGVQLDGRVRQPEDRTDIIKMSRNLIYHAISNTEVKKILRCIHIGASIHAAMRWDKQRKFKKNDFLDFEHATAAVGYFDVFLTEKPLHHLITQRGLGLESINGCSVFSGLEEATVYIRSAACE